MADSNTMTGSVVTGATSGGVSPVVVYYDVTTGNLYDSNGNLFGNNTFSAFLDNNFTLELHYVQDISTSTNPEEWLVWSDLDGQSISSTLAFDNDFLHAIEGKAYENTIAGSSTFKVFVKDLNKDTLDPVGVLVINPFGSEDDKMMVTYSSFEASTDVANLYTFTIQDADGLPKEVKKDTAVRVSAPLYLQVDCNSIYEANIPAHYGEGVFNFPINVISRKLIKELDYRSISGVSGTMEHKIYLKKESLAGISVDGTEYTRDNSGDTAAQDVSYYAWQYTSGGETITLYTKSEVPVLNETVYKKTMEDRIIEANAVIYTDSSTASQTVIKRGTSAPETYTKNNELNEYAPYMFCYWTNERWTRGNEITADTPVYNIVNGTAVKENYTCDPVYSTGFVLYRTFNFPFIVKNLIERDGISLHIPVEDTDWVRAYVISIVKDNMEEIVERASKGTFGVVKVGDNIDVSTGIISVKTASTSDKGLVKVGTNIDVADGTISVKDASTDNKGLIEIANSAEVTSGESAVLAVTPATLKTELDKKQDDLTMGEGLNMTVSGSTMFVTTASTSAKGIVQLVNDQSSEDIYSTTKAITPWVVKFMYDDLYTGKQDNISCDTPINLDGNRISLAYGDGLAVGVAGSTNANKLIVNEASVKEVLEDVVDGGTEPAVNEIVTADNLKGALSVGQAVDVTSVPTTMYAGTGNAIYVKFGNEDWVQVSGSDYWKTVPFNKVLAGFKLRFVNNSSSLAYVYLGFSTGRPFPKFADTLSYLSIADITNIGEVTASRVQFSVGEGTGYVISRANTLAKNESIRLASVFTSTQCLFYPAVPANSTVDFQISNWRQYEVTALTDEAIAYIAQLEDPDAFFRSTSAYSIRDKYLIKQDMVCPFIPTINMPDNSDLTVAAGLSYKIKYTNDNTHTITADTIPTDAYGWDTHIQMFIKGTSAINFQAPLVLMDALTPNAGHNMVVKWRNGAALVYVDDTNAGYIVVKASGTGTGTLNDAISNDYTDYVIFSGDLAGTVIDAGDATFAGGTGFTAVNILGNGTEDTVITGNISAASGKTINFQSLTIDGGTLSGAGTINLGSTTLTNAMEVGSGTTINFKGTNTLNSTLSGEGVIILEGGATITSEIPSGATIGTGIINAEKGVSVTSGGMVDISNITITGATAKIVAESSADCSCTLTNVEWTQGSVNPTRPTTVVYLNNCRYSGVADRCIYVYDGSTYVNSVSAPTGRIQAYKGPIILSGSNTFINAAGVASTASVGDIWFMDKSINSFTSACNMKNNGAPGCFKIGVYSADGKTPVLGGTATIVMKGHTASLAGCSFSNITATGMISDTSIITCAAMDLWTADNVIFGSPVDASAASTVKLSGTTFTTTAKTLNASRIQLPASTTVSFQDNTNPADTKILDAGLIVVGDNPASPSGSATVVNASGTSSTVTGIGTYIDKEGDNDFVANNTTNVVPVDASTTGAKYLGTVLSATTGETGANRFAKIDSGAVAVVNEATNAVNKQIITHDYEPILGGTFSLTSATVSEATKTVAIQSGGVMTLGDAFIPSGSTVAVSGGGIVVEKAQIDGVANCSGGLKIENNNGTISGVGIIDFQGSGRLAPKVQYSGAKCYINGVTITNGGTGFYGATAVHVYVSGCVFRNVSTGVYLLSINNTTEWDLIEKCSFENIANYGVRVQEGYHANLIDNTFDSTAKIMVAGSNSIIRFGGSNAIKSTVFGDGSTGSVTLTSGAILDLTGNTNATPIAPGGGIVFESGGATVLYGEVGSVSSMTLDNVYASSSVISSGGILHLTANGGGYYPPVGYRAFSITGGTIRCGSTGDKILECFWNSIDIVLKDLVLTNPLELTAGTPLTGGKLAFGGTVSFTSSARIYADANTTTEGTCILLDGTTIDVTNSYLSSSQSIIGANGFIGTVIVGANVSIKNGETIIPLTGGTYHKCRILKDGTITEA